MIDTELKKSFISLDKIPGLAPTGTFIKYT